MKSDESMDQPLKFSSGDISAKLRNKLERPMSSVGMKQLDFIFKELEHKIISLMKNELKRFKTLLSPDYLESPEREEEDESQSQAKKGVLKITMHILRKMNQNDLANTLQNKLISVFQQKLKFRLKQKFEKVSEGASSQGNSTFVNEIYTELYITEGGSEVLNNEHEVRQIETTSRRSKTQETPIKCNDIFKALPGQDKHIRTVLTKGVAGIGKTVSVQKFILDWSEGKANQDLHFIFPLQFRELNLMKDKYISLIELVCHVFPEMKAKTHFNDYKVMFIFDGLDECRLHLNFQNNQSLSDIRERASVDVLLTNLIKGNLLPSALIWITSRPAAANQIPSDCVDQITDVRGFNDPQKDEYFIKRINDKSLANTIIKHIKSSRSLYIMCHIPVFCWITATVLEKMLSESESQAEIPKTLTQMFTYFLIFQTKLKSQKYDGKCEVDLQQVRKSLLSLGKLAFQQLEKGNLIFYEEDLRECGIDVREASVYSGVCTQIFGEEFGLNLGNVYSFVHLSIQEFLAAVYKFLSLVHNKEHESVNYLKSEVDKALQSENGHLDLFLRFLLGLTLGSNQILLQGLLTETRSRSLTKKKVKKKLVNYIKMKIKKNHSPEKSINLFYCLNELNDHSLVQEVQTYVNKTGTRRLSGVNLSPSQWSALAFVLLNSEESLDEFILKKFDPSEECLLRMMPVFKEYRKVNLSYCNLTKISCSAMASVLSSNSSSLTELNLSYNDLQDSGVKLLSDGLKNTNCKIEILQLENCNVLDEGFVALALALRSNPSHLTELNLSYNHPGDSGVKLLSDLLKDPHCKLRKLGLNNCSIGANGCAVLTSALRSNPSHLTELYLNFNNPGDLGVNTLSDLLKDPQCKLQKLQIAHCGIEDKGFVALALALQSNPSHLTELNLSDNEPEDSGLKLVCGLLENPHCKLQKLQLENYNLSINSCVALASALRSNLSHLTELNLSRNEPGDSGVKLISVLLKDPHCKLHKLELACCNIRDEGFVALASALRSNPSYLTDLNLNFNKPGDSGVKMLSALLKDPQCKLEKLELGNCSITGKGIAALASALRSNPSHLRELNLNNSTPGDSGLKQLSGFLKLSHCKLQKLHIGNEPLQSSTNFTGEPEKCRQS
nr:NACHT, LRR and PYD domains-containing protein 3-like isoform X2 [Misgurnus anguillicaudatus]